MQAAGVLAPVPKVVMQALLRVAEAEMGVGVEVEVGSGALDRW